MLKSARALMILLLTFAAAPAAWGAEARALTAADIAGMGGTDFKGGVGDYLLRNDEIEAVVLGIDTTGDFGIPVIAEALPGRGILIDAGTLGDKNDQLGEIDHVVNLGEGVIFYGGPAEGLPAPVFVSGGATASIKIFGAVVLDPFPTGAIIAETTYSLTDGDSFIDIETKLTNFLPFPAPIFQISDVDITVTRGRLPFQPFPNRGNKSPPLDLSDPAPAIGVWNYISAPGNNSPDDGPTNNDGTASEEVSYAFFADSVFTPLVGIAGGVVTVAGNAFSPTDTIPSSGTLTYRRKFVVAKGNSVEASLDVGLPELLTPVFGFDPRGTFTGRVVDGAGTPVPNAHVFFDNVVPGADPLLVTGLVTTLDENQDGVVDGFIPAAAGAPLPTSHVVSAADGTFTVKLPILLSGGAPSIPSVYELRIQAPERATLTVPGLVVSPANIPALGGVPTALGDIVVADTGTLAFSVQDFKTKGPVPAKLTILGDGGTENPDFGSQYLSLRNFSGLSKKTGDGLDPVTEGNSSNLSENLVGSPALTFHVDADGTGTLDLKPGSYIAFASRGLEYTIDAKPFTIAAGQTTSVSLEIDQVVDTSGYVSMDFHVHSAKSFDSSVPMTDRVVSFMAGGVDVMVSTDHDYITDYDFVIGTLGATSEIAAIVGNEMTGGNPVPADPTQGGLEAFPEGIGHWNAWPLSVIPGNRRNGAPQDEFVTPGTAIDRLRGMDSLPAGATPDTATIPQWLAGIADPTDEEVVMLNHPRAGFAGVVVIGMLNGLFNPGGDPNVGGYDPTIPITSFPNNLLFTPSLFNAAVIGPGGTSTTALSFDAVEVMNGSGVGAFLRVRDDWCSFLDQGIHKTGTAVSDSHRLVLENPGFARSFVASSTDDPAGIDEDELTANVKAMQLVGTSGPFMRVFVEDDALNDIGLGETAVATGDKVTVKVRVEAAPWIPVEEVRIYANCDLVETIAIQPSKVLGKVLRFNRAVPLEGIASDAYITVEAGIRLDASGDPVSPGLLATVQTIEPGVEPFGFTNPIFVDRDGNGYTPPGLP